MAWRRAVATFGTTFLAILLFNFVIRLVGKGLDEALDIHERALLIAGVIGLVVAVGSLDPLHLAMGEAQPRDLEDDEG